MQPEDGRIYEPAEDAYLEYMTVQPGEQFNFRNVWYNQSQDTHPPLYYLILHMICSLFPGTFSIWYAGIINIVFAALTLWSVRRIVGEITHSDRAVLAASIAFAGSAGILSGLAFLRMYVMALFFVTYVTWLMLRMIKTENPLKITGRLAVTAIFGALTHYYFIVYLFFGCILTGIYLLCRKSYGYLGVFALSVETAGAASILIFPAMLHHMFFGGQRSEESLDNLANLADYAERLKTFYNIINRELFGNLLTPLAVLILLILLLTFVRHKAKGKDRESGGSIEYFNWIILIVPSVCYFLFVAKAAIYDAGRYIFPVYAVVLAGTVCILYELGKYCLKKRYQYAAAFLLLGIVLISGWRQCSWEYLYRDSTDFLNTAKQYGNIDCVYIYDDAWEVQSSYKEISQYNSVVFWNADHMDAVKGRDYCGDSELIVCILNDCDQQAVLNKMLSFCPRLNSYEKLGGFGYATTWRLYGDGIEVSLHHEE